MINQLLKKSTIDLIYDLIQERKSKEEIYNFINKEFIFQKDIATKKALFGYLGGKTRLSKQIINYIPDHKVYVEPFCGSSAILFAKGYKSVNNAHDYREIINDLDNNVYNFFLQLRDNTQQLIDYFDNIEYSNTLKKKIYTNTEYYNNLSDVKKAVYYFFNVISGYASRPDQGFAYSKKSRNHVITKLNKGLLLKAYAERLQNCHIFNEDYKKIIQKFDSKDTFFYIDPPYENTQQYTCNEINYEELPKIIKNIKGKWMLSNYRNDYIENNFKEYNIIDLNHYRSCCKAINGTRPKKECNECIIMNYNIEECVKWL